MWVWWHGEANLQTIYFLLMRGWIHGGPQRDMAPSAVRAVWCRLHPVDVYRGAQIGASVGRALAAAALLTFSPTHVYYSQEARSYTLTIFLVLLVLVLVRAGGGRRPAQRLGAVDDHQYSHLLQPLLLGAGAGGTGLLAALPQDTALETSDHRRTVILAAAIPGLTYIFRASPENLHFIWMPQASPRELWHLGMFFGGSGAKVFLALILWIAGLIAIARTRGRDSESFWRGMLIVSWAVLPAVITALVSLRHPDLHAALPDLLAAGHDVAGRDGNDCAEENACRSCAGRRAVRDVDTHDREGLP